MDSQQQGQTKTCSFCGEQILLVAIKCKHCGSMLNDRAATPSQAVSAPAPPSVPTSTPFRPYSFTTSLVWFWLGSAPGYLAFGVVAAGVIISSGGDAVSENMERAARIALLLGGATAVIVGLGTAAVFGQSMSMAKKGTAWFQALGTAGALAAALGFFFRWMTQQFLDSWHFLKTDTPFWVVAAVAMLGGAVLGGLKGQGAEKTEASGIPSGEGAT